MRIDELQIFRAFPSPEHERWKSGGGLAPWQMQRHTPGDQNYAENQGLSHDSSVPTIAQAEAVNQRGASPKHGFSGFRSSKCRKMPKIRAIYSHFSLHWH
jgi:hypothetical protein